MSEDKIRFLKVKGKEWMGLSVIDFVLGKGTNYVTGENAKGKTRVLMIFEALLGKDAWPEEALSKGAKKGSLEAQLGDDDGVAYIIKWSLTSKGGMRLSGVEKKDGTPIREPQRFLQKLCGNMLDPWEFIRLATSNRKEERTKAVQIFKSLCKITFDAPEFVKKMGHAGSERVQTLLSQFSEAPLEFLKAYEQFICENRKDWKQQRDTYAGTITTLEKEIPEGMEKIERKSLADLAREQQEMATVERKHAEAKAEAERLQQLFVAKQEEADSVHKQLVEAQKLYGDLPPYDEEDAEELVKRIEALEENNKSAEKVESLKEMQEKLDMAEDRIEKRDELIQTIRDTYQETLEGAEIPVKGFEVVDGALYYNGLPLSQASKSEALRNVSIQMGAALKPTLRAFVIRDGDSMTDATRAILEEACDKYGVQTVIEVARDAGPCTLELMEGKQGVVVADGKAKNTGDEG